MQIADLEKQLGGKRILFICLKTFKYEFFIHEKLKSFGAQVDYFDERPSNSTWIKGVLRIKRSLIHTIIKRYYENILLKLANTKYDYFFLVKGEVIPLFFIEKIKTTNPNCQFIYYTWDSFENNPNPIKLLTYFDKKFTFDHHDAIKYNLELRPLFYIDNYKECITRNNKIIYKLLFIGTAHSDRYRIGETMSDLISAMGYKAYCYYYLQSVYVYYYMKFFNKDFEKFDLKKIEFQSLEIDDIIALFNQSEIVLDINHPGQRGLTMRTFEALGAHKKLITTNENAKYYSFYNSNNILIIDRMKIELPLHFIESEFVQYSEDMDSKMSISGWLYSIFVKNEVEFWMNNNY